VVAIQNSSFKRKKRDPTTTFGLELIKDYGTIEDTSHRKKSEVSYRVEIKGREVKSTTTPLFDENFGLLGFLCLNIPIEEVHEGNVAQIEAFFERFYHINENKRIDEVRLKARSYAQQEAPLPQGS
ncbi:MAG: PAS domain-containing protein, partial [Bacteroidota bacterium]